VFVLLALVLVAAELTHFLYRFGLVTHEVKSDIKIYRAYFLIVSLVCSYSVLSYNLFRYYRFDFHQNKKSMLLFFVTEFLL
jgi:hypothetical protein